MERLDSVGNPMFPELLGDFLVKGVGQIDRSCNQVINGIEGGLVNVKSRFAAEALNELGNKLTEETLISWQLSKRLQAAGLKVELERKYPGSREECDIVLHNDGKQRFWVEVKLAWKKYHLCDGNVKGNSAFKGYLLGDASHPGTAHDFRKLMKLSREQAHGIAILLIGFDSVKSPMDGDIAKLMKQESIESDGWQLSAHDSWLDRRNEACRINCWFWARP